MTHFDQWHQNWARRILAHELGGNREIPFEEDVYRVPQGPQPVRDSQEAWKIVAEWLRANQVEYRSFRTSYLGARKREGERTPVVHVYGVDPTRDTSTLLELAQSRSFSIVIHAER